MNHVTVVEQPDYKLKISVEPLVNSTLNKIELTREYFNEGVQSNSTSFIVFLDQDSISKLINALQTTRTPSWSLANDDHQ
jgi:hypothetical protein